MPKIMNNKKYHGKIKFEGLEKFYNFSLKDDDENEITTISLKAKFNNRPRVIAKTFEIMLQNPSWKSGRSITGSSVDKISKCELMLNGKTSNSVYKQLVKIVQDGFDVVGQEGVSNDFWVSACKYLNYNNISDLDARQKFFEIVLNAQKS